METNLHMVSKMTAIYSIETNNENVPIPQLEIYNDFLEKSPGQQKFMNPLKFKKKASGMVPL
jgi:hypothetical protein